MNHRSNETWSKDRDGASIGIRFAMLTAVVFLGVAGCTGEKATKPTASHNETQAIERSTPTAESKGSTGESTEAAEVVAQNVAASAGSTGSAAASDSRSATTESQQPKPSTVAIEPRPQDSELPVSAASDGTAAESQTARAVPRSAFEAVAKMDMRDVSPYELKSISYHNELVFSYLSNADAESSLEYHINLLQDAGWSLSDDSVSDDAGNYISRLLFKDRHIVSLGINAHSKEMTSVIIKHLGNIDARQLPMIDNAEPDKASTANGAMYRTDQPLESVVQLCRQRMAEFGWMEYKDTASTSELPYESTGARVIPFVQNGTTCYLNVYPGGMFSSSKTTPSYWMTGLIAKGVSIPSGATDVHVARQEGNVSYTISRALTEALADVELWARRLNWEDQTDLRKVAVRDIVLTYLADSETVYRVELEEEGFSSVRVSTRSFGAEELKVMREENLASNTDATEESPDSLSQSAASGDGDQPLADQILASEFPIPEGAKITSEGDPLMIESDLPPNKVSKFYDKKLSKLGWKSDEDMSQELNDMRVTFYEKGDRMIQIIANKGTDGFPSIIAQGNGIHWPDNAMEDLAEEPTDDWDLGDEFSDKSEVVTNTELSSKAANKTVGEATLGSSTVKLNHAVAYQVREGEREVRTVVLVTDRQLPKQELLLQLSEMSEISLFDLDGRVPQYIEISWIEDSTSVNCYIAGASLSGIGSEVDVDVQADKGWIRGKISMKEPREVFGDDFTFSATIDLAALNPDDLDADAMANAKNGLKEIDELPVPAAASETFREGSQYATTAHLTFSSGLSELVALYREKMPELGWKENDKAAKLTQDSVSLSFVGAKGEVEIVAKSAGQGAELSVTLRDVARAKKDNMMPPEGKGKLFFGNAYDKDVVITIGKRDYKIKAGLGADDPKEALQYDVAPGKYVLSIKVPGESPQQETIQLESGTTWGVMILPNGIHFADRLY